MFVSEQKKRSNISEYLLYMWHIEDLVRAASFNVKNIKSQFLERAGYSDVQLIQLENWYAGIIQEMESSNIKMKGHLNACNEVMAELVLLHNTLIDGLKDQNYIQLIEKAKEDIAELREKSGSKASDVEVCFNGLYGLWMLKLKKAMISDETTRSFERISRAISYLTKKYHEMMNV